MPISYKYTQLPNFIQLSKILDCRNGRTIRDTNVAMEQNLSILRTLGIDSKVESDLIVRLARQSYKDSKTLKALTVVATAYLPASLIAVS